ncbi:MAG: hypothetical protein WCE94_15035 [Candidatus Methanoperedens sp.]
MDEDDLKSYHAQHSGKLLGMDATDMVTYWSVMRSVGGLYGAGLCC